MSTKRTIALLGAAAVLAAATAACGAKPEVPKDGGQLQGAAPAAAGTQVGRANGSEPDTDGGNTAVVAPDKDGAASGASGPPDTKGASLDPESARTFLATANIPNGDIYLGDGGLLHINVVGLDEEIEERFAEAFPDMAYKLVNVRYTHEELELAQHALIERDLMRKLNLYASAIDVIGNRLLITMPDSSDGAQAEIGKVIDPDMVDYRLEPLGDPHLAGKIHEVDEAGERLLILVDGEEEPSYWLSFDEFSEIAGESGEEATFDAFDAGQAVRIWTTGMVLESMPAQATVRRIELE